MTAGLWNPHIYRVTMSAMFFGSNLLRYIRLHSSALLLSLSVISHLRPNVKFAKCTKKNICSPAVLLFTLSHLFPGTHPKGTQCQCNNDTPSRTTACFQTSTAFSVCLSVILGVVIYCMQYFFGRIHIAEWWEEGGDGCGWNVSWALVQFSGLLDRSSCFIWSSFFLERICVIWASFMYNCFVVRLSDQL